MDRDKKIYKKALSDRKAKCDYVRIEEINSGCYCVKDKQERIYELIIDFVDMNPMPEEGDGFYLTENIIKGMKENLYSYTFSTRIGEVYARDPHDFLTNPEEFLIFEYKNGKTVLLEQWYG